MYKNFKWGDYQQDLINDIAQTNLLVCDTETNGLEIHTGQHHAVGYVFGFPNGNTYYIPVAHGIGSFVDSTNSKASQTLLTHQANTDKWYTENQRANATKKNYTDIGWLITSLQTYKGDWVFHNAQFDLDVLYFNLGIIPYGHVVDTMLGATTLNHDWGGTKWVVDGKETYGNRQLKWLAKVFKLDGSGTSEEGINEAFVAFKNALPTKCYRPKNARSMLWAFEPDVVHYYAEMDAKLTLSLYNFLVGKCTLYDLMQGWRLLNEIQKYVLWRAHITGMKVSHERAQVMLSEARLDDLEHTLRALAGEGFNPNSYQQIKTALAERGIEVNDTKSETLERYADDQFVSILLKYREYAKLVGTYIKPFMEYDTLRGSISFETVTLRTSSREPNLQNIPRVKGDVSPKLLLYPTDPNKQFVEIDFSGAEATVAAWLAEKDREDKVLTDTILHHDFHSKTRDDVGIAEIILNGEDEHTYCARHEINDFKKHCRQLAKTINFAILYGGGISPIKTLLGISERQARQILEGWRATYYTMYEFSTACKALALTPRTYKNAKQKIQYVEYPLYGFKRRYDLYSPQEKNKTGGVYSPMSMEAWKSANHLVQGTSGLICLDTALQLTRSEVGGRLDVHNTVHDSILVSVFPEDIPVLIETVEGILETFPVYPPLKVEYEVSPLGGSWGEKKLYDHKQT